MYVIMKNTTLTIHQAVRRMGVACVKEMMDGDPGLLEARDSQGRTPLLVAAYYGRAAIARLLIERGANLEALDYHEHSPLIWAVCHNHPSVVRLLIDHGANVNGKGYSDVTPLHEAAWHGNLRLAKLLIEKGADVRAVNVKGHSALNYGCEDTGSADVVALLVDRGADVNGPDFPLRAAVSHNMLEIAQVLIERGADVRAVDPGTDTALHYAACCGALECVNLLLDAGADVNARNELGSTPLAEALSQYEEGEEYLREFPSQGDEDISEFRNRLDIHRRAIEVLREHGGVV